VQYLLNIYKPFKFLANSSLVGKKSHFLLRTLYFQKLIWSPWLQVTFLLLAWEGDFEICFV
jgi:hypothetical protein